MNKISSILLFITILLTAFFFRFYRLNWDQNQHLHPDERFLTMVTNQITWPENLREYFQTNSSSLNPHNNGFNFFVYGTFPIFFTKYLSEIANYKDYNGLTQAGRALSAVFDLATVVVVFLIAKIITLLNPKRLSPLVSYLAMFFYAVMVLPIQLAHFYAVETYLTFFLTACFYLALRILSDNKRFIIKAITALALGLSFGLAVASKISAVLILPVLALAFAYKFFNSKEKTAILISAVIFCLAGFLAVRIFQPYLFADAQLLSLKLNPKILDNWKELANTMKPQSGFPPSIQWYHTTPLLFPLKSLIFWGMGTVLGILAVISFFYTAIAIRLKIKPLKKIFKNLDTGQISVMLMLLLIAVTFVYQGIQTAPTIRYFHPVYPLLAVTSAIFFVRIAKNLHSILILLLLATILAWPVGFLSVYRRNHSRVIASEWIYNHLPKGSTIGVEHWDDGLPLTLDGVRLNINYNYVSLPLYNPDSPEKWRSLNELLAKTDYLALTSNRLWGSITRVPEVFPQTSRYYEDLFAGNLGFKKIAEITSYPQIPLPFLTTCIYLFPPQEDILSLTNEKGGLVRFDECDIYTGTNYRGIVLRDDWAEETFTVYDHPKVLIFQKVREMDYQKYFSSL